MLHNNKICEWADFTEKISLSTLSNYLNSLIAQGYVEKPRRGQYQITDEGVKRFNELSMKSENEPKLNYPPELILKERYYDDIILWMTYNNNSLKWSDFLEEPLSINQSSLSKNLGLLQDQGFVKKENKEYKITSSGKIEYSRMLKSYDLDRQSILDEEARKIEEITKKTTKFFEKFDIVDDKIKFRFLNNILKFDYNKVQGIFNSEEGYHKFLLFISINHPENYPTHVSLAGFSESYDIKKAYLDVGIDKLLNQDLYSIKIFQLKIDEEHTYYFQENEKTEKILRSIVDDYITKYTYLNKLYEYGGNGNTLANISKVMESIKEEVIGTVFHSDLEGAIKNFLPNYIEYLAYTIETKKEMINYMDKLEGIAWRNIPDVFQIKDDETSERKNQKHTCQSFHYYLNPSILEIFKEYIHINNDIMLRITKLRDEGKNQKAIEIADSLLKKDSSFDNILIKSILLCLDNRYLDAKDFIIKNVDLEGIQDEEEIFLLTNAILSFAYMGIGEFKKALELSKSGKIHYPDHALTYITNLIVQGFNAIFKFNKDQIDEKHILDLFNDAVIAERNKDIVARIYQFKSLVLISLGREEEALNVINLAIGLEPDQLDFHHSKIHILWEIGDFETTMDYLDEIIKKFPEQAEKLYQKKAYNLLKMEKYEEALNLGEKLTKEYPKEGGFLNLKAYALAYLNRENEALETIRKLLDMDGNAMYIDTLGEILMMFGYYKDAIKEFKRTIDTEVHAWYIYQTYIKMGISYKEIGELDKAIESFNKGLDLVETLKCEIKNQEYWIEKAHENLTKIKSLQNQA